MAMHKYDVIVVGLGGMGSATVYQLAKRGKKVLGIEQFQISHELGSSHGLSRIIRLAYHEGPQYVGFGQRAYELWRTLETEIGEKILHITGSVHAGPPDSSAFKDTLNACVDQQIPHQILNSQQLNKKFPGYQLPNEYMAVFQQDGGFLVPEKCIEGHVNVAINLGAEIHLEEQVMNWEPLQSGVKIITNRGEYESESVVFTVGAWASKMLPELKGFAVPERQVVAWFETANKAIFDPKKFPVFIISSDSHEYYGFPIFGIPGYKVGKFHHVGEIADPDHLDRTIREEDKEMLLTFTQKHFPEAAGRMLKMVVCMFTNSPDHNFIIGQHQKYPQISYAAGFSGHGFKFCSTIGEVMADLAENRNTIHDISIFSPNRFIH
ncbi:MAG: N-methyl-L-tryptophan oxidase [SAR202 cluster bacterium]|nr:N-methyl-L-tryptophan oxidase [SAR202 cluster bacterium]|tara:strand:- start:13063 stop:14199 length:1137 start_codon:yes stop_codon:yes gene_type:complete